MLRIADTQKSIDLKLKSTLGSSQQSITQANTKPSNMSQPRRLSADSQETLVDKAACVNVVKDQKSKEGILKEKTQQSKWKGFVDSMLCPVPSRPLLYGLLCY